MNRCCGLPAEETSQTSAQFLISNNTRCLLGEVVSGFRSMENCKDSITFKTLDDSVCLSSSDKARSCYCF